MTKERKVPIFLQKRRARQELRNEVENKRIFLHASEDRVKEIREELRHELCEVDRAKLNAELSEQQEAIRDITTWLLNVQENFKKLA